MKNTFKKLSIVLTLFLLSCATAGTGKAPESSSANSNTPHVWDYDRKFANMYSEKDDIKIGEYYMKQMIKEFNKKGQKVDTPKNQALKTRIENIVNRIKVNTDEPNLPYEVHIFDAPDIVNAFCMPGGKIGVFTGLFDKEKGLVDINSDDEIAAVMSHEIAHATQRHVTRTLTTYQGINIFGAIASAGIGEGLGGNAQYVFNQVFNVGMSFYLPSYSRKYESEADRVGLYTMSKSGYNPQAAIDLWKRAAAKGGPNSKKTDIFASHPADGVRAKNLEKWLIDANELYRKAKGQ